MLINWGESDDRVNESTDCLKLMFHPCFLASTAALQHLPPCRRSCSSKRFRGSGPHSLLAQSILSVQLFANVPGTTKLGACQHAGGDQRQQQREQQQPRLLQQLAGKSRTSRGDPERCGKWHHFWHHTRCYFIGLTFEIMANFFCGGSGRGK